MAEPSIHPTEDEVFQTLRRFIGRPFTKELVTEIHDALWERFPEACREFERSSRPSPFEGGA